MYPRNFKKALWVQIFIVTLSLIPIKSVFAATQCTQSIADLYDSKSPAVLRITALTINPYKNEERIKQADGSGFIIDNLGLVMTNSHVVFGAQVLNVTLDDGTVLPAKLLGADPIYDLAILKIPQPDTGKLPTLNFADSDKLRPGDEVVTIGNPMGLGQTITSGIVSALNRTLPERPRLLSWPMIQTDTPINPGNSGGPILNRCGDVVGIASEIMGDAQNIGFALPSNLAESVVGALAKNGRVIRPWLGFDGDLIDAKLTKVLAIPLSEGFLVESIESGSPANLVGMVGGRIPVKVDYKSYILGGDIIMSINNISLKDDISMQKALDLVHIGSKLEFKIFRNGKVINSTLDITEDHCSQVMCPSLLKAFLLT